MKTRAICLVGSFAASDYLFSRLDEHFKRRDVHILRPDIYLNKVVADGAVLYGINRLVSGRVSKHTFGVEATLHFDLMDDEHVRRSNKIYISPSGHPRITGIFSEILGKGQVVLQETEFRKTYSQECPRDLFDLVNSVSLDLKCYCGHGARPPRWMDSEPEFFEDNCEVKANLASLKHHLQPRRNGTREYYSFELDVVLVFGSNELKAQIAWMENGVEKRGPASIVYDTTATRNDSDG